MKATTSQKIKIGIFVVSGLVLLVIGIFFIGKQKNMFGDTFVIYGTFKNVGGLQVGNNIRFAGINIGTVENIEIITDSTIRVDMRLQSKIKRFLKVNALASIGSDGLMGDKLITIAPGTANVQLLGRGDRIMTLNPVDYDKIIIKLTKVADNAEVITSALAGIVSEISHGKGTVGRLLYNDTLAKSLEGTVNSAHQTMQAIKQGSEGFNDNMTAMKHNILLRGYYKKKAKKELKKQQEMEKKNQDK
ncbi:MAG TPA: MlaD family protein [Flavipsychrobacter sp.]|nr:MlaD family protein [Flavipsychrobacter sp.]